MGSALLGFFFSLVIAFSILLGWMFAHSSVAYECRNLGAFFVGEKVYECKLKEKK